MLGVTVGIGAHRDLAEQAAVMFRRATGHPAVILGDEELYKAGTVIPHCLRYRLFDFVDDDRVVYFDADLFFVNPWDPEEVVPEGELGVVRDLMMGLHLLGDVQRWMARPQGDYFNSGMMVLTRAVHRQFLEAAERITLNGLQSGILTPFFDQTPLNLALDILQLPVCWLDRRYNWVQQSMRWMEAGFPVIGAHKFLPDQKAAEQLPMLDKILNIPPPKLSVPNRKLEELAGDYIYELVGKGTKVLELRKDGTIGKGQDWLEANWLPVEQDGELKISIQGHTTGNVHNEVETCRLSRKGESWEGNWLLFEKSKVILSRTEDRIAKSKHAESLIRLLSDLPRPHPLRAVEVGVFEGETSRALLEAEPELELWLVDSWKQSEKDSAYAKTKDRVAFMTQESLNIAKYMTALRTAFAANRVRLFQLPSLEAARLLKLFRFDLVFIDANHCYEAVVQDTAAWWPLVWGGGILCGHDYDYPESGGEKFGPEVKRAVDEFVKKEGLELHLEPGYVWWVRKPIVF